MTIQFWIMDVRIWTPLDNGMMGDRLQKNNRAINHVVLYSPWTCEGGESKSEEDGRSVLTSLNPICFKRQEVSSAWLKWFRYPECFDHSIVFISSAYHVLLKNVKERYINFISGTVYFKSGKKEIKEVYEQAPCVGAPLKKIWAICFLGSVHIYEERDILRRKIQSKLCWHACIYLQ